MMYSVLHLFEYFLMVSFNLFLYLRYSLKTGSLMSCSQAKLFAKNASSPGSGLNDIRSFVEFDPLVKVAAARSL